MSVSNLLVKETYAGNGATVSFAIPFDWVHSDDATVKVYKITLDANDLPVYTLQVEGALQDYTLSPVYDAGNPTMGPNNVVFAVAPTVSQRVLVIRSLPITQALSVINSPNILSNLEGAFDKLTKLVQQIADSADRALKIPLHMTSADFDPTFPYPNTPATAGDHMLQFSADGLSLALGPTPDDLVQASADVATITAAVAQADADAAAAAVSAANAATSATAASASATAAALSETNAANSEATAQTYSNLAAASAAAAAASALSVGYQTTGPFVINEGFNSNPSGEITDHTVDTAIEYKARIIRGTTVFALVAFYIVYRNGSWNIIMAGESDDASAAPAGVTFTVNSSGQINAAVAADGTGNASITFKKMAWAI